MASEPTDSVERKVADERARCVALVLAARAECDDLHSHVMTRLANAIQAGEPAPIKNPGDSGQ
jgi:hypothetical protein